MSESVTVPNRWFRLLERVERVVLIALVILLVLVIVVAVIKLWVLFVTKVGTRVGEISDAASFQDILQGSFGNMLVVLLGLELLETMKVYFKEHHVRVEVILFVAIIAMGRHIIQVDLRHESSGTLFGLAALMLALATSYFLLKRGTAAPH